MKPRWPSPALVVSIIALVVACAGTAYAAVIITSSSQIKNGVITGADLRNSTITNADVRKGTLTGSKLRNGTVSLNKLSSGTQRLIRRGGGGSGAVSALEAVRKAGPENQPANVLSQVTSMKVPAGAYVVTANTIMTAFTGTTNILEALVGTNGSVGGTCILDFGGVTSSSLQTIAINDRQTPATLGTQLTRTVGAETEIVLRCASSIPWRASESSIIATKVDSIALTVTP